jgi:glycosyltransferase involved in cell wall biosynthesis
VYFSIIIPTINRTKELDLLLNSIQNTKYTDLEIIIVDQNNDSNYLISIINKYENLSIKRYNVNFKGAAKARNFGFKQASGTIVNFMDDDAEVPEEIFEQVRDFFTKYQTKVLFGRSYEKGSEDSSITKFITKPTYVKKSNLYKTTVEFTMFIKREAFTELNGYDTTLGVGTKYGAEEGADLVLRLLNAGYEIFYSPNVVVYHPNKKIVIDEKTLKRAYSYGLGFGRMCAKHIVNYKSSYELFRMLKGIVKPVAGIVISAILFKKQYINLYISSIKGRLQGFKESYDEYKSVKKEYRL